MSIPDKLVEAAASGLCIKTGPRAQTMNCSPAGLKHPECALAAAFAALPECEEAVDVVTAEMERVAGHKWRWHVKTVFTAVAQQFGAKP